MFSYEAFWHRVKSSYLYLAQSTGAIVTLVGNGNIVASGNSNIVTPIVLSGIDFIFGMVLL